MSTKATAVVLYEGYTSLISALGSTVEERYEPQDEIEAALYETYRRELQPQRHRFEHSIRINWGIIAVRPHYSGPASMKVLSIEYNPRRITEQKISEIVYRQVVRTAARLGIKSPEKCEPSEYAGMRLQALSDRLALAQEMLGDTPQDTSGT